MAHNVRDFKNLNVLLLVLLLAFVLVRKNLVKRFAAFILVDNERDADLESDDKGTICVI